MGKLNPMTLVAGVIAVLAIGLSVFMFIQVSNMNKSLANLSGDTPIGLEKGEEAGADEHGDGHGAEATNAAIFNEKVDVNFNLGKFTANTSDKKYAVMDITLVIESTFYKKDFDQYQALMDVYNHDLEYYNNWNAGKIDKIKGTLLEDTGGDHAYIPSGTINAAHGGPTELPAPAEPVEPSRPLTALEQQTTKSDSRIRDEVFNQIGKHTSEEIISPEGKPKFKQALIDGINHILGDKFGEIKDLYFIELIVT